MRGEEWAAKKGVAKAKSVAETKRNVRNPSIIKGEILIEVRTS